jgi:hypothetical protein
MGEMPDETAPRSRRALLAAAAGGAAALAAQAALPLTAAAADPNDVVLGAANSTTTTTSITTAVMANAVVAFTASSANATAVHGIANGDGVGVFGSGVAGAGVQGNSNAAGIYGISQSESQAAPHDETLFTGVYGWSPAYANDTGVGVGVWGDSEEWGVYGSGTVGVYGFGSVGVVAESASTSNPAIVAFGATSSSPALEVNGKVKFNRAGRKTIGAGKSSLVVTMAGVTTTSKILAVLNSNRSGRYVRAVVAGSGKFTIYLNSSVSSSTYVAYFVFD